MLRYSVVMAACVVGLTLPDSVEAQDPRAVIAREMISRVGSWITNSATTY